MSARSLRKRLKRRLLAAAQRLGVFSLLQRRLSSDGSVVYVLTYHRVDEPERCPWLDPAHISASPQAFEAHMRLIASQYHPVDIRAVLAAVRGQAPLPHNAVLVTVDDAYRDFGEVLYPIARQFGIRPVLFVPTAFVGSAEFFWWDKLYQAVFWAQTDALETPAGIFRLDSAASRRSAVKHLSRYLKAQPCNWTLSFVDSLYERSTPPFAPRRSTLTWDELRALAQDGVAVAPHTHTHPILTRVSVEQACKEIRTSRRSIARHLGEALPVFAYPDGKVETFNPAVQRALRIENIEVAFTMLDEQADLKRHDPLQLPRIGIWAEMTLAQLHWRLTRF